MCVEKGSIMDVLEIGALVGILIIVIATISGIISFDRALAPPIRRRISFAALIGLALGGALMLFSARSDAGETTITPADILTARVRMAQESARDDATLAIADLETHVVREKFVKCVKVKGKKKPVCKSGFRNSVQKRLMRKITLIAIDEATGVIHPIVLSVPHPLPEQGFPYTVLTPGYTVEHLAGRGVIRLSFRVWKDGEELVILTAKHPWVPSKYWSSRDLELVLNRAEAVVYTQPVPHFLDRIETPGLVKEGFVFWNREAVEALEELKTLRVRSLTFPDRMLAATISSELLVALGAIEQMDDRQFLDDPDRTADTVAIHYALNRDDAFSRAVSSANARGAYQFTEKNGNGTYSLMVRECVGAQLIPDFEAGTQDLRNMLKAAACYLDYERANLAERISRSMGDDAKEAYLAMWFSEPRLAAIYPVAAYNAGPSQAWKLYREFPPEDVIAAAEESADELGLPKEAFVSHRPCNCGKGKKKRVTIERFNGETYHYLVKLARMWPIIERWSASDAHAPTHTPQTGDACCVSDRPTKE